MFYAQLKAVMAGEAPIDSVSASTLSFQIYNAATKILAAERWHREAMINDHPPGIAELVRAEVLRIYAMRRAIHHKPKPKVQAEPVKHCAEWENWA